ncbi:MULTISPECIES: glycosyltransferase [unclassified Rhodococcus (in: high G+C Gram-positive bacteria)]|uniref:glycosyltransferase n=1 Tax=unclassified Rhodococcus (in: high G+C Gram-positive bacteria) TaxID=192944 RepID=UPI00163A6580|nr:MULTISPECIES: glycosyltransferase [unclassified Rhodococcus (in: high G+C Gram-positive bacteria)]MBC2641971.1 glycosyltransferase [Rhodococcus sp. 3A]MBC2893288.1 glycosyltransferase [Rhodococcus sp. 4CII]
MSGPPLRIALVASCRFPIRQPFAGGLESHVWWLARSLSADGHQVTLFAGPGSDPALGCTHLDVRTLDVSAAARADTSMPSHQFMAEHHAYLQLMLDLAGPLAGAFDVVHNHSLHYLPVAMAATVATPILCTLHTPPTPWLESAIAVGAGPGAYFAAVSAHTAAAWQHVVGEIDVIPNGVDLAGWPAGPGGRQLIWFGRLVPEKGAHLAITAAQRAGRPLVLAGPVSDAEYFAQAIRPRLGADVTYLGHLEQPALAAAIGSSAAALVTPVWDEPYGLVVAEALACGTPVAAFARGGIPEVLTPDCGRLVPPDDLDALVRAIPVTVGLSRTAARARAREQCSERIMVDAYVNTYRRLTQAHHSGATARPTGVTL